MLDLFKNFQKDFERLEKDYPHFWFYFKGEEDKGRKLLGLPNDINWDHARVFFFFLNFETFLQCDITIFRVFTYHLQYVF